MKFLIISVVFLVAASLHAQELVLKDNYKYTQEAILPVSNTSYVLVKDSTAFLYNVNAVLPYKKQILSDIYILNDVEKKLYTISLVPQYLDQIEDNTQEIITLVTYVYETNYAILDKAKTNELVKQYSYFIPKTAVPNIVFNQTIHIEDSYATSIYQNHHLSLPSYSIRIDKNNILAVHANGDLVLTEVKNHKVNRLKKWTNFNGSISLVSSVKIGDIVRIKFQRYQPETDKLEDFWSIINIKNQTFVNINLKDFFTNLKHLQEQDVALLNSTSYFHKAINGSNIRMFVLPNDNFVWLDDKSYYYGSDSLSEYANMQKEDKNFSLNTHAYLFNYPSRILRAIAPQKKDTIRTLEKVYVKNKQKIIAERCMNDRAN